MAEQMNDELRVWKRKERWLEIKYWLEVSVVYFFAGVVSAAIVIFVWELVGPR